MIPSGPTVTAGGMQAKIKEVDYTLMKDGRTTFCQLTMENGFTVWGKSSCVCIENYNRALGEKFAYEDAFEQLWKLEGYLLSENVYQSSKGFASVVKAAVPYYQEPTI
jgi:hypothetical protein